MINKNPMNLYHQNENIAHLINKPPHPDRRVGIPQ
jgi:hypothetical protein